MKCAKCPTPRTCEAATTAVPACQARAAIVSMDNPKSLYAVSADLETKLLAAVEYVHAMAEQQGHGSTAWALLRRLENP